jgi:hypothetical protein
MAGMLVMYLILITLMMNAVVMTAIGEELSYRNKDYIIVNDTGGSIREYIVHFDRLKDALIIVNGLCNSACTLVLGNRDVCVTDRAIFGFHAASNHWGTQMLMQLYPERVLVWLAERGGLTAKVLFARGDELAPKCKPD